MAKKPQTKVIGKSLSKRDARVAKRNAGQLASIGPLPKAKSPKKGNVIVAALMGDSIRARGKVEPEIFFPDFCAHLAKMGYSTHFVFHPEDLLKKSKLKNSCIIHMYNEERNIPVDVDVAEAEAHVGCVFNGLDTGRIIKDKIKTNMYLSARGVTMPSMEVNSEKVVFTNLVDKTSKGSWIAEASEIDPDRYNTKYIDTRIEYEGTDYFTTVRLLTVGREIVHAFVGARPADANKPTVHGVNTPRNSGLVTFLYKVLYEDKKDEMQALADDLDRILGPGFYHHDLLIENGTGDIYTCEVGYKFDAYAYGTHLKTIKNETPCIAPFYSSDYAHWAADALIRRWQAEMQNS